MAGTYTTERLKIFRLKNTGDHEDCHVYAAARDRHDALKMALRKYDWLEPWTVAYCGAQHDGKPRHRGLLAHDEVMRLFALPRTPK